MNTESQSAWKRCLPWLVPLPRKMFEKPQTGKQMLVYYLWRVTAFYVFLLILLMLIQRWLIYQPTRVASLSVDQANGPFGVVHEIQTTTEDGLELKGWHILAGQVACSDQSACDAELEKGQPVVIFLHGNGGNRMHRMEDYRLLASLNLHVFAFDYRGYAENPGSPSQTGLLNDARAFWKYAVRDRKVDPSRIILFGESLGGGVATLLASELCEQNTPPAGLILRSTFSSLVDAASSHFPWIPVSLLVWDRYPNQQVIGNITCPILMIHGTADRIVPFELGEKLFAAAPESSTSGIPKKFVKIEQGTHNDLLFEARGPMVKAYRDFTLQLFPPDQTEN